jgi:hypothetical protein
LLGVRRKRGGGGGDDGGGRDNTSGDSRGKNGHQ